MQEERYSVLPCSPAPRNAHGTCKLSHHNELRTEQRFHPSGFCHWHERSPATYGKYAHGIRAFYSHPRALDGSYARAQAWPPECGRNDPWRTCRILDIRLTSTVQCLWLLHAKNRNLSLYQILVFGTAKGTLCTSCFYDGTLTRRWFCRATRRSPRTRARREIPTPLQ